MHEAERSVGIQLADAIVRRQQQGVRPRPRPRRRAPRFAFIVDATGADPEPQTRPVGRAFHLDDTEGYKYRRGGNSRGPQKDEGGQAPPSLASSSGIVDATIYIPPASAVSSADICVLGAAHALQHPMAMAGKAKNAVLTYFA